MLFTMIIAENAYLSCFSCYNLPKMAGKHKLKHKLKTTTKPTVVVGSDESIKSSKYRPQFRGGRKQIGLISVGVVILVVLGGWATITYIQKNNAQTERTKLVNEAAPLLLQQDVSTLKLLVVEIVHQQGYKADADSLYIVTNYYLLEQDASNAKNSYTLLEQAYNPQKGYSNANLRNNASSISDLKQRVDFFDGQFNQAVNNSKIFSIPAEKKR
jgi:hypothetical protein